MLAKIIIFLYNSRVPQSTVITEKKEKFKMAKFSTKMGIQEQIIESAGTIYNYLNTKGEV